MMQGQTGRDDTRRDEGRAEMRWCVRLGELGWAKWNEAGCGFVVGQRVVGCGGVRRGRVKRRPGSAGVRLTETG